MNSNGSELEEVIDFTSYLIGLVQSSLLNILIFKSLSGFQSSLLLVDFATIWKPVHTATKSGLLSGFQFSLLLIDFRYDPVETRSHCDE